MTIDYRNGMRVEGIVLRRSRAKVRVAVKWAHDILEFTRVDGVWVSEEWEPVQIHFDRDQDVRTQASGDADCICSRELASRLIHYMSDDGGEDALAVGAPVEWLEQAVSLQPIG